AVYTTSLTWTTSGTGTFSNFETLHPVYTPGAADITAGTVTLTLTGTSASPCISSTDAMVLTIHGQPVAYAGSDATICQGTSFTVSTASAGSYTALLWTAALDSHRRRISNGRNNTDPDLHPGSTSNRRSDDDPDGQCSQRMYRSGEHDGDHDQRSSNCQCRS
ncbi:MAG: hypothetical protein NT040_00995, partial [Bacteroidetes bacterium]|nr:hypothetical protein [Bacteroidota bacterium]